MIFHSTKNKDHRVSFKEAIFKSLPPDNGLYFPEFIPELPEEIIADLGGHSEIEIAFAIAKPFIEGQIPESELFEILEDTLTFSFPLTDVEDHIKTLELFHGPTWAFKDVGARFLSRCMGYFTRESGEESVILVATSGDTGSAVAAGFYDVPGVEVKILYPKNKVSEIQQKQLTSWGKNINAFEVNGTFDDCQKIVKSAFLDKDLNEALNLSSANSINIARLLPQSFYYFFAIRQLESKEKIVFSVPSGNFGNLTAGVLAQKLGLPIDHFIAATNVNRVVPDYLETGKYVPQPAVQTYANAMDVGDPSNFVRLLELFHHSHPEMAYDIKGFHMNDDMILETIRVCYEKNGYLLDPHGAIAYEALKKNLKPGEQGIFMETAHPVKFLNVVDIAIDEELDFKEKTKELLQKGSYYHSIEKDFAGFKEMMLAGKY